MQASLSEVGTDSESGSQGDSGDSKTDEQWPGGGDIVSRLPVELGLKLLTYLRPEDMARSCRVCKCWRTRVNDDLVWKRLLARDFPEEELTPLWDSSLETSLLANECKYKRYYNRGMLTVMKWNKGEYKKISLRYNEFDVNALGNGGVVVVLPDQDQLEVYDLNRSVEVIQKISLRKCESRTMKSSDEWLVVGSSSGGRYRLSVFRWAGERLETRGTVALSDRDGKLVPTRDGDEDVEGCLRCVGVTDKGVAALQVETDYTVWSLTDGRVVCTRPGDKIHRVECTSRHIFWMKKDNTLEAMAHDSTIDYRLEIGWASDTRIFLENRSGVLVYEGGSDGEMRAWDSSGRELSCPVAAWHYALHPTRPLLCYSGNSRGWWELCVRDLELDQLVWRARVPPHTTVYSATTFHLIVFHWLGSGVGVPRWEDGHWSTNLKDTYRPKVLSSKVIKEGSSLFYFGP